MTVLSHQSLKERCSGRHGNPRLIRGTVSENFRSASYDLRLGHHYYLSSDRARRPRSRLRVSTLDRGEKVQIPANELILFEVLETIHVPDDLVGHLTLKVDLLQEGLMMASQSQIDAGYDGPIFGLLYNLSDTPVVLPQGRSVFRLEFTELDEPTLKPYSGDYGKAGTIKTLREFVPHRLASSLAELSRQVRRQRRTLTWAGIVAGLAIIVAGLGLASGIIIPTMQRANEAQDVAAEAEQQAAVTASRLDDLVRQAEQSVDERAGLLREIAELRLQLDRLEASLSSAGVSP